MNARIPWIAEHPHRQERSPSERPPDDPSLSPSARLLGAHSDAEAYRMGALMLNRSAVVPCCGSALAHVYHRLGTTFFLDDDPEQLARAFPPAERQQFNPRLLAACIVLCGRRRVSVFDRS